MSSDPTSPDRRVSRVADKRVRLGVMEVLGRISDPRAVEPLTALLGDEDQRTREVAGEALGRVGEPAIESLLKVVLDPDRSLEHRCLSLGVIKSIGSRRRDVSDAMESLLRPEEVAPARLRRQSLYVAARLRDARQIPYAEAALSSDDWQTVCGAAELLSVVPSPDALTSLQATLERWSSTGVKPYDRKCVIPRLVAAMVGTGQADVTESIRRSLEQSVQGGGSLDPEDAVGILLGQDLPGTRSLLLKCLVGRVDKPGRGFLNRDIITFLSASWEPAHIDELNEAAQALVARGIDIAAELVDAAVRDKSNVEDDAGRAKLPGEPTLYTLAKARRANFVTEAGRLLGHASVWLSEHICEALWVANDACAERPLLIKFEQSLTDEKLDLLRRPLVRALGTCGTEKGGAAVLDYLRSDAFEIFMPPETLPTLVRRRWLNQKQLTDVARDDKLNPHGRKECVIALGVLDASGNRDLFRDVMFAEGEVRLRRAAVRMLGTVEDAEAIGELRRLLRATDNFDVASSAAEILAGRKVYDAIPDIEDALKRLGTTAMRAADLAVALARLGQPSHLPLVIEAFYESRPIDYGITEDLGVFLPHPRAERVILEQLETSRGMYRDAGEQKPAVRALARHNPDLLFKHALRLHRAGRLDPTARLEMANRMHSLAYREGIDEVALIEVFKLLICDWYLPARERALQALGWADAAVCTRVYEDLRAASDSWTRACAVSTLAFCGEEEHIRSARFEESILIRAAADAALVMRRQRASLGSLTELYKSADDLVRLSAYFSIKGAGDEITIWKLDRSLGKDIFARTFIGELAGGVHARIKKDREDRDRKVNKYVDSNGGVRFDSPPFAGGL